MEPEIVRVSEQPPIQQSDQPDTYTHQVGVWKEMSLQENLVPVV